MLFADSLSIDGHHAPLLRPTSLVAPASELTLVTAPTQQARTALALGLSGRMKPDGGSVAWESDADIRAVRRASALVDSPEINEPEQHLRVKDLVAEDLALLPGPFWGTVSAARWLASHRLDHLANEWVDAISPEDRLHLLASLSLQDGNVKLLVFDSPDRHDLPGAEWTRLLRDVSTGRRQPAVVAVVQHIPDGWDGRTAAAEKDNLPRPAAEEHPDTEEPTDPQADS
ncbi:ABC transporter ATP-binding protein [Zhihengliuella salsuginis]|uniref:ABC transporter ATP-binding protein n=1 Tax=Zhihengliuella salsuginis TaxID=578222 RepID=A0ABQ3GHZ8_9MICC|nr:ABC transporter ATP-binding protein [Zhihengliuella salsuginis]GHD05131.1 ABC transporter ATP-binding protein [Zhihengliuella salsuginis]